MRAAYGFQAKVRNLHTPHGSILITRHHRDTGGSNKWINHILQIFALFMFTGVLSTLLVPETKVCSQRCRSMALPG